MNDFVGVSSDAFLLELIDLLMLILLKSLSIPPLLQKSILIIVFGSQLLALRFRYFCFFVCWGKKQLLSPNRKYRMQSARPLELKLVLQRAYVTS